MLRIGLTGGIGAGKSLVARLFALLGAPVYDADSSAKKLMIENDSLKASIIAHFGTAAYQDKNLNRTYLASRVFNNPRELEVLNRLVHPVAIDAAKKWLAAQSAPYAIKEAALLFESGSAEGLDYVIGVTAPENLRIKRVMERDGLNAAQVKERMHRQLEESIKIKLCDFILHNDEQQLLIPQVLQLHEQLLGMSQQAKNPS
ncbi:MAG: dephospho-CoA kinase [Bacteroidetes bacterium]|nr:dephospho-CoA kinase [Bacteroidota bacterium]